MAGGVCFKNAVVFVNDIERSKAFYMNVLDQEIEFDFNTNIAFKSGVGLWAVRPDLPVAEALGDRLKPSAAVNQFELYFETEDFEAVLNHLKTHEISFLHGPLEEPWGQKTVRFFDPDQHVIEVGETMPAFVRRFAGEGFSIDRIVEKTGMDEGLIKKILAK